MGIEGSRVRVGGWGKQVEEGVDRNREGGNECRERDT